MRLGLTLSVTQSVQRKGGLTLPHVADANARLSIDPTGKVVGYRVIQDDGPTTYEFQGAGADTDAGLWVTGAFTVTWNAAYRLDEAQVQYSQIYDGGKRVTFDGEGTWSMAEDYSGISLDYPWDAASWTTTGGGNPPPVVTRNPIASEANWTIVP